MVIDKYIGKRIKQYRMLKGITQEQLAEQVDLSRNYISSIERGVSSLSIDKIVEIINALDCTADDIFTDVINKSYDVKVSKISEQLYELPKEEQERVLKVIEVLIETAKK